MAFLQINADLTRTADALERIAAALERISPPIVLHEGPPRKTRLIQVNPADIAEAEEEADRKAAAGTEGAE